MKYLEPKVVRSRPGLSQEQALLSLQNHPEYKTGTQIKSMVRQANRWVATIIEPKEAVFPPKADDEESSDDEESPLAEAIEDSADGDDDSEDSDGPPKPKDEGDGPPKPDGEDKPKGELGEVLSLLHEIIDGLGIAPPGVEKGLGAGPEAPVGPKPGPPMPGGPGAGPGAGGPPPPGPGAAKGAPGKMRPLRDVPPGANPISGFSSQRVASFTATASDDGKMTIKQAKEELELSYPPYKVKQIRRSDGKLHALLSIR